MRRALTICSDAEALQDEINHLTKVFCKLNQYPRKVVENIINEEKENYTKKQIVKDNNTNNTSRNNENEKTVVALTLPYGGRKGENLIKRFTNECKKKLNEKTKIQVTYKSKKLGDRFNVKDKTKLEHKHNVTYKVKCLTKKCSSTYGGETKCRIGKRMIQHNKRDKASHVLNHSKKKYHRRVWLNDVEILGQGYTSTFKRKISESLYIKQLKPDLNKQKDAYKLKLFN